MTGPWILGVSYSHNGAACLLRGDEIVVAIQEERLSGIKRARIEHYQRSLAVRYCLDSAGIAMSDVDLLVACAFSTASPPPPTLTDATAVPPRRYLEIPHHLGHARGVFATSGFDDAAVLIIDGQGGAIAHLPEAERAHLVRGAVPGLVRESEVASIYRADRSELALVEKHTGDWIPGYRAITAGQSAPRSLLAFGSLGGMYAAVSALIFGDAMEAGKVMGLAPYGSPRIPVERFFTIDRDGGFRYSDALVAEYAELERWPANRERFADLAASLQAALEHAVLHLARRARRLTGNPRLCYAGGVALNSVANERLTAELDFEDVHVMPAAEDSGTAIGAAYHGLWILQGARPPRRRAGHDSTGRRYTPADIADAVARVPHVEAVAADPLDDVVSWLCDGQLIGWFQGGSELGPRALGQRSILCDPRRAEHKAVLNDRVKQRESFRPFAPVILREELERWFEASGDRPYMLRVCRFRAGVQAQVPAVVHVDGSGRVQTVTAADNEPLYRLVQQFHRRTGVPILLNTSFNVAGEPIVETPEDALWCLLGSGLDAVVLGGAVVRRAQGSLLALYPRLRARRVQLALPVTGSHLALSLGAATECTAVVDTAHGELGYPLRAADLGLLRLCDGTRDGWAILDELARTSAGPIDDAQLARRLYLLRRGHVIALGAGPAA